MAYDPGIQAYVERARRALGDMAGLKALTLAQRRVRADRYAALATPMPADPGSGAALVEITGGRRMADGRLGALVTIAYPSTPQPKTFFFTFLPAGDRVLIDDILGELTFSLP